MKALCRSNTIPVVPLSVAAMELRIAPAALYQCALRGELRITRIGRHWYCERSELDRFGAKSRE